MTWSCLAAIRGIPAAWKRRRSAADAALMAVALDRFCFVDCGGRRFLADSRCSSFRCIAVKSGVGLYMSLSPSRCGRRIGESREPSVVGNVKTAQIQQLRSADDEVGLRIRLLGPVAIAVAGRPVALASRKARALVGYLALREGTEVSRSFL